MSIYALNVDTDVTTGVIRFRLEDEQGVHLAARQVQLSDLTTATWEGLFDTRQYVQRYAGSVYLGETLATAESLLADLGVKLGRSLLGEEILGHLTQSQHRRSLLVKLPAEGDALAVALARVPWEIARSSADALPLMEQNLVVRLETQADRPQPQEVGTELRVLLVFAEAPGARPLAMRQEREELQALFKEIMHRSKVRLDVLCHGVSRSILRDQIARAGGYHVVHWSGHGHLNLLELCDEDGKSDTISGEGLVNLFREAGGFIPQLVFLSACLSGTFVEVKDWATLGALLRGEDQRGAESPERELPEVLTQAQGYTGTALALLGAGVPQAIAMRYEVGDDYARQLARTFYHYWLQVPGREQYPPEGALAQARSELIRQGKGLFGAVDHATPLMFGVGGRRWEVPKGRSPQLKALRPQPQPLLTGGSRELEKPLHFVGRGKALQRLSLDWLESPQKGVALVQGLAGMGKTALAAEALHLWHQRFDWVLGFQGKPLPLQLDEFYRQIDTRLTLASAAYREKCQDSPYAAVYLPAGKPLSGPERYERLQVNLLETLQDENILLVLDNFEPNLETVAQDGVHACADPQWDRLLTTLVETLPNTGSRLLITSRLRPQTLTGAAVLWLPMGPLPMGEANLFLRTHPVLRELLVAKEYALLQRLLKVSRGHPLILDRLGTLAQDRPALEAALERLEAKGLGALSDLFTEQPTEAEQEAERRYLEDVAIGSIDLLLQRLSADARRLLWLVTLANEPVSEGLIAGVWSGQDLENEQLTQQINQFRQLLSMMDQLPAEVRQQLEASLATEEGQATLAQLEQHPTAEPAPPLPPLLAELHSLGLLTREGEPPTYDFHELVKERMATWMANHPAERADRSEGQVWIAYGERYAAQFEQLMTAGGEGSREAAVEAGRRALVYMIRAGEFDRLGSFASKLVTTTQDPNLLRGVIAELETIADQVPPGQPRWSLRTYLADALLQSGQPDQSLPFYEQAIAEAEAANHWTDVGWISGNWATALQMVGQLAAAKTTYLRSVEATQKAGSPPIEVIGSELEALRIDVIQGEAATALPEIEAKLEQVRRWWQRHRAGETVPEAPDPVVLGRVLVAGLDVARFANQELEQWQSCLDRLREMEQVESTLGESEHKQARTRFNQYGPLLELGQVAEAQRVLESCLATFREVGHHYAG